MCIQSAGLDDGIAIDKLKALSIALGVVWVALNWFEAKDHTQQNQTKGKSH